MLRGPKLSYWAVKPIKLADEAAAQISKSGEILLDFVHIRTWTVCSEDTCPFCVTVFLTGQIRWQIYWMFNGTTEKGLTGSVLMCLCLYISDSRSGVSEATPVRGVCGNRHTRRHQEQQLQRALCFWRLHRFRRVSPQSRLHESW